MGDPSDCGGALVRHFKLGGYVCARCGYYWDDVLLKAFGVRPPLWCSMPARKKKARA